MNTGFMIVEWFPVYVPIAGVKGADFSMEVSEIKRERWERAFKEFEFVQDEIRSEMVKAGFIERK